MKNVVVQSLLERLTTGGDDPTSERIWRFSERMAAVYIQQMEQFDEDEEARQWHRLYSVNNMPEPSDTRCKTDVAAMMGFYSPTNFCKFQKLVTQQLLDWEAGQTQLNPYPLGASRITILDLGAGVGIASLAVIDVLSTWADVVATLGYKQLGISLHIVAVEPDINKQGPRRAMLSSMSKLLDRHSVNVEQVTEVISPYPEPDCVKKMMDAAYGGSLVICCMSNFLSSPSVSEEGTAESFSLQAGDQPTDPPNGEESASFGQTAELLENAERYAEATARLLADIPFRNKLLLASELRQRGPAIRSFAASLHPSLELSVQWNRVRFYSPVGSYWHSLRSSRESPNPDWATGFWSLAHLVQGSAGLGMGATGVQIPCRS